MGRPASIVVLTDDYRQLARMFYRHRQKLGYAAQSCKAGFNYLNEFLHWLERQGRQDINSVTAGDISRYYAYIGTRPGKNKGGVLSLKTTHRHMQLLRDFFEMLLHGQQVRSNPTATLAFSYPREEAVSREVLTPAEIQQLYESATTARQRALLSLGYGCGLRVGEVVSCNREDVRLREKILIIPGGKGNKRRVVPLSAGVIRDLSDYLYGERMQAEEAFPLWGNGKGAAFMLHSRGGRMQKKTCNALLKQLIGRTGNKELQAKKITMHHLRHSIATHLLEQGMPLEQVRVFLGHSQLETTQLYTHVHPRQLKKMTDDDT